jgi:quercetin dioxygenase-like cupin family protein
MKPPTDASWTSDGGYETTHSPQSAKSIVLVPGVELRPLGGTPNSARNLFTGLLTLAPGASYPAYVRPSCEALVLLDGDAAVNVEERRYLLEPLDGIVVAPQQPRGVANLSTNQPASVLISVASSSSDQMWVNARFKPVEQPRSASGRQGSEQIRRHRSSAPCELAPRATGHDLFQADLGSQGICGGYAIFEAGARLPCHRHEFDESITVLHGTATCVVEGRRHDLSGNASALIPRGRCHYVINLTLEPMTLIWVQASDRPLQIDMEEAFCQAGKLEGNRA